jgi:hypothetical protein
MPEKPGSAEADQKIVDNLISLRKAGISPLPGSPADAVARAAVARTDVGTQPGAGSSSISGAADRRIRSLAPAVSRRGGGPGQPLLGPPDVADSRAHLAHSGTLARIHTDHTLAGYDSDPFRAAATPAAKREAAAQRLLAKIAAAGGPPIPGEILVKNTPTADRSSVFGGQAGPSTRVPDDFRRLIEDRKVEKRMRRSPELREAVAAADIAAARGDDPAPILYKAMVDIDERQSVEVVTKGAPVVTVRIVERDLH